MDPLVLLLEVVQEVVRVETDTERRGRWAVPRTRGCPLKIRRIGCTFRRYWTQMRGQVLVESDEEKSPR